MISTMPVNMMGRLQTVSECSTVTRQPHYDDDKAECFRHFGRGMLMSARLQRSGFVPQLIKFSV